MVHSVAVYLKNVSVKMMDLIPCSAGHICQICCYHRAERNFPMINLTNNNIYLNICWITLLTSCSQVSVIWRLRTHCSPCTGPWSSFLLQDRLLVELCLGLSSWVVQTMLITSRLHISVWVQGKVRCFHHVLHMGFAELGCFSPGRLKFFGDPSEKTTRRVNNRLAKQIQ